jgi:hypothetical protein
MDMRMMNNQEMESESYGDEVNENFAGCSNCSVASVKGVCNECVDCRQLVVDRKPKRPKRSMWQ